MLIEESGIAKGIRRIVGFTRLNAQAARSRARDLLARLSELEALPGLFVCLERYRQSRLDRCLVLV